MAETAQPSEDAKEIAANRESHHRYLVWRATKVTYLELAYKFSVKGCLEFQSFVSMLHIICHWYHSSHLTQLWYIGQDPGRFVLMRLFGEALCEVCSLLSLPLYLVCFDLCVEYLFLCTSGQHLLPLSQPQSLATTCACDEATCSFSFH